MASKTKPKLYVVVSLENGRIQTCATLELAKSAIGDMWNELDCVDEGDDWKTTLEEFRKGLLVIDANKLINIESIESVRHVDVQFGLGDE